MDRGIVRRLAIRRAPFAAEAAVLTLLIWWCLPGRCVARKLLWPLDARISPTSSFCEYRPLRYHAGVDFSTGGRVGVPVIAVDHGYVWRVRVSPYGYGKVVYLRLGDGRIAAYAHLSAFNDAVEALVLQEQMARQQYSVDLFLNPGQVRVRRGEIIALSGRSGVGVPHLHFEIRDSQNRPLNPFANGLELSDTTPPTMASVAFVPLDGDARVDERLEPAIVPLANYHGLWTSKRVPLVWGRIGVALMAWDITPHGRYRLSVYATGLAVDGKEVFRRRYDRLSLANEQLSGFDRNFTLLALGDGRYYNLFLPPGNALQFYDNLPVGAGILVCGDGAFTGSETLLAPGVHELKFTASDFAGTSSEGTLQVGVGRAPQIEEFSLDNGPGGLRLRVAARDSTGGVRLTASTRRTERDPWRLAAAVPRDTLSAPPFVRLDAVLPADSLAVHLVAQDTLGHRATSVLLPGDRTSSPRVSIAQTWGRAWLEVDLRSTRPMRRIPTVRASWPAPVVVRREPTEVGPGLYEADIVPDSSWPKSYKVRVLTGAGRPTIAAQWIGEGSIPGSVEFVPDRDTLSARYRGVITFQEAFPESGVVRVSADEFDTTFAVKGKLLGPFGGEYSRAELGARVEFGRGVLSEPMFVRIEAQPPRLFPELQPIGPTIAFQPQEYPLAGDADVTIQVPDTVDLKGVALYGVSPRQATCLALADSAFDHTIRARVPSLYTVAVYRDTTGPTIHISSPRREMIVRVRRPLFVADVRDAGAGFSKADDALEMRVDGNWAPAEYDPEENTFTYQPPTPLEKGVHTVEVHARDQVGNESSASLEFTVE